MVWGGVRFGVFLPGPSMDLILPCAWNLNLRMACQSVCTLFVFAFTLVLCLLFFSICLLSCLGLNSFSLVSAGKPLLFRDEIMVC